MSELTGIEIRALNSLEDYEQCVLLQRDTWGHDFTEVVPATMLKITHKVGGVVGGAFDTSGKLVGFVYGISGVRYGRPAHWSHMLAVRPHLEGLGLGTRLKAYQRDILLDQGIEVAHWTFDPLVARNAYLNLTRLGTRVTEYVPNMYGQDTQSSLHSGLGTDRLVVEWELGDPEIDDALAGRAPDVVPAAEVLRPINSISRPGRLLPKEGDLPDQQEVQIEVPSDIQRVKEESLDLGMKWRTVTRRAFLWYLSRGYEIRAFYRDPNTGRGLYLVKRQTEALPE
jgi:predicted GNAT superfamily acetyltransferase